MKTQILSIFLSSICTSIVSAQHFQKVSGAPWNNINNDSRAVAWIDYNQDGLQDIFITNGPSFGQHNLLYRNDGWGQFTQIIGDPLVTDGDPSDGTSWADYDNNGYVDAFIANWYGQDNLLFQNGGQLPFSAVTSGPIGNDGGHSETGTWGDYDNDGFVDLYVTNSDGDKKNFLYHNNGNGTFTKIDSGELVNDQGASRSVNWIDFDLDGDVDLFVANEFDQANDLYRNDDSVFSKMSIIGFNTDLGNTQSSSWADFDLDGDFDVFVTNFSQDNRLYLNQSPDSFIADLNNVVSNDGGSSFGSNIADIDNDGDEDVFVCNAYSTGPALRNFLYLNNGDGSFTKIDTGAVVNDLGWTFGAAFGDYDLDGDMDLMCANNFNGGQKNVLYRNMESQGQNPKHWVTIRLKGQVSNVSAIGALVRIKATIDGNSRWQIRQISAHTGYCGQNMLPAHFGLGDASAIDSLVIDWPAGSQEVLTNLAVDSNYVVLEGAGIIIGMRSESAWPAGRQGLRENHVNVFPNPAHDRINLDIPAWAKGTIIIYDRMGRVVLEKKHEGEKTILLPEEINLNAGIYFLIFQSVNGSLQGRFIVKAKE